MTITGRPDVIGPGNLRCKHCGRRVYEQITGAPPRPCEGTGIYVHMHSNSAFCFPFQRAEVDEDNPGWEYEVPPEPKAGLVAK